MKRNYSLFQKQTAYILLISFFLQNCGGGFDNRPLIPTEKSQMVSIQAATQYIEPLVGEELIAQGGHSVAFHEEGGELKADVIVNAPEGFSKTYEGIQVYVEQGADLTRLPRLDAKAQARRIHLHPPTKGQPAKLVIYKEAGLLGRGRTNKQVLPGEEEEEYESPDDESRETNSISNNPEILLGESIYSALKNNNQSQFKGIINGISNRDSRQRIIGYVLYLAAKDKKLPIIYKQLKSNHLVTSMDIRMSFLEAIKRKNSEALQSLYEIFAKESIDILPFLLDRFNEESCYESTQENFKFLACNIEIPDNLLEELRGKLRILAKENLNLSKKGKNKKKIAEQTVQNFLKEVVNYINYKKLYLAIILPTAKSSPTAELTYDFSTSSERKEEYYSDSEEEEAPHFNGVYNLTKYGILNIEAPSFKVFPNFDNAFIDNYVTTYDEITCNRLKQDAGFIRGSLKNLAGFPIDRVTILCVALRQYDGRMKKFVFTNQLSVYQYPISNPSKKLFSTKKTIKTIVGEAHQRGYHVIMAQQAHAEAEFIQFLQERPSRYTHLIAMGCSRPHCEFCNEMLEKLMGKGVLNKISESGIGKSYDRWLIPRACGHFLAEYRCKPNIPEEVLKANKEAATKYWRRDKDEKEHQQLDSKCKWHKRPWARSNHKVRKKVNTEVTTTFNSEDEAEK
jgi:hypothetical protein